MLLPKGRTSLIGWSDTQLREVRNQISLEIHRRRVSEKRALVKRPEPSFYSEILRLRREEKLTTREIGVRVGKTPKTVSRVLDKYGIFEAEILDQRQTKMLIIEYLRTHSIRDTAKKFGKSRSCVWRYAQLKKSVKK